MATTGNNELSRLGEVPTLRVDLPAVVHETPADEAAVAIADVPVNPAYLDARGAFTTTVVLPSEAVASVPADAQPSSPLIPPLPELVDEYTPAAGSTAFMRRVVAKATFQDAYRARTAESVDKRIGAPLPATSSFIPVLSRKGGVGATIVTALLGMAIAEIRDGSVLAMDAHADRGTLADRVTRNTRATIDDAIVRARTGVSDVDMAPLVSRDETGLDVLAASVDPSSSGLSESDLAVVSDLTSRFYPLVLQDMDTSLSSVLVRAALRRASGVVIVSGGGIGDAHLASETITWLESQGFDDLAASATVVVNTGTQSTDLDALDSIEQHFEARARAVARLPYDPALASGGPIHFAALKPLTRDSARDLAAALIDGLATSKEI